MIKFKYLILIPVLAALLAGCGAGKDHKVIEMAPVSVEVGVAKSTADYKRIQVSGRIEAVSSANVSTRMMGNVSKVLVKPGDHVNKGDLLLQISGADLKAKEAQVDAAIVQAKSGLENARNDYERFQTLYEKGSASKKEFENMTTRFEVAKAGLEAAEQMKNEVEAQFAYTNLRAPFTGVITNTFVKAGDIANPGMPLATVEGIKEYQAAVMVPESQISKVQAGAKVSVLVKSKNRSVDGTVKEVSRSAKNTGGQFLVKIDLDSTEDILPGMFVNAAIAVDETVETATSPVVLKEALIRRGQLSGIYVLGDGNTAILRWVRIGNERGSEMEILSGLSEGEKYLFKPQGKLFNGAKVLFN